MNDFRYQQKDNMGTNILFEQETKYKKKKPKNKPYIVEYKSKDEFDQYNIELGLTEWKTWRRYSHLKDAEKGFEVMNRKSKTKIGIERFWQYRLIKEDQNGVDILS